MLNVCCCLATACWFFDTAGKAEIDHRTANCGCCPHYERIVLHSLLQHVLKDSVHNKNLVWLFEQIVLQVGCSPTLLLGPEHDIQAQRLFYCRT
jgi:hypothetical protein